MSVSEPAAEIAAWLDAFGQTLARGDIAGVCGLFLDDSYWRDLVGFTWNIVTLEGVDAIAEMLEARLADTRPSAWALIGHVEVEDDGAIGGLISFETVTGRGRGHVRLKDGRCWTLMTALEELKGFEEPSGARRPMGAEHGVIVGRETWTEARERELAELGTTRQPYCVIIGGGQGGLALATRLRRLNVPTIVLESNARIGDNWRKRYRSLVLHDPVWYDHLPYLPFPDDWPVFSPKDKFADWLEMYGRVMELNLWTSSAATSARYDETDGEWHVDVDRDGQKILLRPRHLVFATGAYGPPIRPDFPGADGFSGELIHSSDYVDGAAYDGKRCVVIGTGSSGHDIAADLFEHGAEVTMIQRSPTIVVRSETMMKFAFEPLYSAEALAQGITTDVADHLSASVPKAIIPELHRPLYETIAEHDRDYYARLAASGFLHHFGEDGSGLMSRALRTASGFYYDVGASELICRGDIAVRSGVSVAALSADGVVLSDGSELAAELVVCATGYHTMDEYVAELVSREVADRIGPCWGIGSGIPGDPGPWLGELRNLWKPTAQPGLWVHGGNLALSRYHSLHLALQLKARMEGLMPAVYRDPRAGA